MLRLRQQDAQEALLAVAKEWAEAFDCALQEPGWQLSDTVLIRMGEAVRGRIHLALQNGKLKRSSGYNAMDFTRCAANILERSLGCRAAPYSERLHEWMQSLQSKGAAQGVQQARSQVGVASAEAFQNLVKALAVQSFSLCPAKRRLEAVVNPLTALVHLCEVRQCLQFFGVQQCRAILGQAHHESAQEAAQKKIDELQSKGARGLCHAVLVMQAAACALGIKLVKPTHAEQQSAQQACAYA